MIFAELTAPGRGGISTIAVLDETCADVAGAAGEARDGTAAGGDGILSGIQISRSMVELNNCFVPGGLGGVDEVNYRRMVDASGAVIDEVIVRSRRLAGDGSAGETGAAGGVLLVEIHCHGGPASVAAICGRIEQAGGRRVDWRELTEAAGRAEGESGINRAADMLLPELPTSAAVEFVLRQRDGLLEGALRGIIADLAGGRVAEAESAVAALLDGWRHCGRWLARGPRVAIIGAPNVGKSSLLNALAGHERAIVDETPGTTRDIVGEQVVICGLAVELRDTAGLRASADAVERVGVEWAWREAASADVRLCLVDLSRDMTDDERRVLRGVCEPRLLVGTKSDIARGGSDGGGGVGLAGGAAVGGGDGHEKCDICTSSLTGQGLAELGAAILRQLGFAWPAAGEAALFAAGQAGAIQEALAEIRSGRTDEAKRQIKMLII